MLFSSIRAEMRACGAERRLHLLDALSASVGGHAVVLVVLVLVFGTPRAGKSHGVPQQRDTPNVIWLARPGPVGGGGGGGGAHESRPRKAQRAKPEIVSPVVAILAEEPREYHPQPPIVPIEPVMLGLQTTLGAIRPVDAGLDSRGRGSGAGADSGAGPGNDGGRGSGLGDGDRQGWGGGPPGRGDGVTSPVLIRQVRPGYTSEAMRARAQGVVAMEAVVLPDGSVGDVRIIHAFHPPFGLDQEAIDAVKQWRFLPGIRRGQPASVLVSIELTFTLR